MSKRNDLNNNLKSKLNPINFHLSRATNPEDIVTLGDQANIIIREFLLEHPEVFVNSVLDCMIQRESQFTRKKSVTVQAESIFQTVRNRHTVCGEIPGTTPDATWNSVIYNLPKGTMKFVLNSSINTLPTKSNL